MIDQKTYDHVSMITEKIDKLRFSRYEKLIQFIRHILTISFGLLSVLIAFKPENNHYHAIFSGVLISTGLSCLLGLVFLHHVIDEHNQLLTFHKEKRADVLNGDLKETQTFDIKKKPYYECAKYGFYLTSIISLILLIVYGILN